MRVVARMERDDSQRPVGRGGGGEHKGQLSLAGTFPAHFSVGRTRGEVVNFHVFTLCQHRGQIKIFTTGLKMNVGRIFVCKRPCRLC